MTNNRNAIIYGRNLFGFNDATINQSELAEVRDSGFNTVILWPLNVDQQGNFFYHDDDPRDPTTAIVANGQFNQTDYGYLPPLVRGLKAGGTVAMVLFGIGGAGSTVPDGGTFYNVKNLLASVPGTQTLLINFQALIAALSLDGFDLDLEDDYGDEYRDSLVQLTLLLAQQCQMAVTYCPFTDPEFWWECLAQVYEQNNQQQAVRWWNLQCYAGGAGNDQRIVRDWVSLLTNSVAPLGIANPAAFVIPGFWSLNNGGKPHCVPNEYQGIFCPCALQTRFTELKQTDPGIAGGFVWNYKAIKFCQQSNNCNGDPITVQAYAQAVLAGLS